ncbi:hypothetical protein K474DRAFT_1710799 [Panus rudis PR-1116 ss-1]|nr:hypothetical protein K474DRAFT_1710799 [Panus rudis PR-1116 ss-1]
MAGSLVLCQCCHKHLSPEQERHHRRDRGHVPLAIKASVIAAGKGRWMHKVRQAVGTLADRFRHNIAAARVSARTPHSSNSHNPSAATPDVAQSLANVPELPAGISTDITHPDESTPPVDPEALLQGAATRAWANIWASCMRTCIDDAVDETERHQETVKCPYAGV